MEHDRMESLCRHAPPVAPARPFTIEAHGDARTDDWYWLRESTNPEVIALLEAENAYTESTFTPLEDLREKLYGEIAGRTPETDCSVPVLKGNWWYFRRTYEGKSYPAHCAIPATTPPALSPAPSSPSISTTTLPTPTPSAPPALPAPPPLSTAAPPTFSTAVPSTAPSTAPPAPLVAAPPTPPALSALPTPPAPPATAPPALSPAPSSPSISTTTLPTPTPPAPPATAPPVAPAPPAPPTSSAPPYADNLAHGYEPPPVVPDEQSYNEVVLLDENQLAENHPYMAIGNLEFSRTGNLIAYSVDTTGNEHFTLYIDTITPREGIQRETLCSIEDVSYGIVFDSDDLLYYVKADDQDRPYQVWCHKIYPEEMYITTNLSDPESDLASEDTLIYEEYDERFFLSISSTKDGYYMLIDARSKTTSETLALPLHSGAGSHTHQADALRARTAPAKNLRIIQPRSEKVEYSVEHCNDAFILLTNESAPDFRIISVNDQHPTDTHPTDTHPTDKRELVAHTPGRRIEDIDVFNGLLAVQVRKDAMSQVKIVHLDDVRNEYFIEQPPAPSTCCIGSNYCMESPYLRYETTSLISPKTTYDLDLGSGQSVLRKRQHITGSYDEAAYITMRLEARSYDGTLVPISIACSRDTARDGKAPCLLYGYGSYEHSIDPAFSAARLSLLERGFVFAIAHVRGGGEMGRSWYENGKLASKPNTFRDYIACANYLVDNQWTCSEKLVARGGSAGGMLMGAVANMAPELFRAIVAEVPFVDCLTTMMDPSLPLTITEWEEWGNPLESQEDYAVMKRYSPYDNIRQGVKYPDILATCGLSDPRVGYFEPLKWVQRLRKASPESRILLMANMDGGHMGPSGRYAAWEEEAQILAFIIDSVQDLSVVRSLANSVPGHQIIWNL